MTVTKLQLIQTALLAVIAFALLWVSFGPLPTSSCDGGYKEDVPHILI